MTSSIPARITFVALALGTIALGLVVHYHGQAALSAGVRDVLGDALWAAMIGWWIGAVAPGTALWRRGLAALAVSVAVELSQLYHAPGLDAVRQTQVGRLVLGSDFDWRDLAAYALGVVATVGLERGLRRRPAGAS